MVSDKFIWRRGDTFHFRRRLDSRIGNSNPISISLKTKDPDRARILARRLAARWDIETVMMERNLTAQLTISQKSEIFRAAMIEELDDATAYWLGKPFLDPVRASNLSLHYAAAYDIERERFATRNGEADLANITGLNQETVDLIRKTHVCHETLDAMEAPKRLERVGAAPTLPNRHDASLALLAGWAEARRRCSLLAHPAVQARSDLAAALLDDEFIASVRLTEPACLGQSVAAAAAQATARSSILPTSSTQADCPFATHDERRFSEVIDEIIAKKRRDNEWTIDKGDQKRVLSIFGWVTGNKQLFEYRQDDIDTFTEAYELAPPGFQWMKHIKANPQPAWDDIKRTFTPGTTAKRSNATYNRDIGVLQGACQVLGKTAWKPRVGKALLIAVGERKSVDAPHDADPKRMPWTASHLHVLFSSHLYTGGGSVLKRLKPSVRPTVWQDAAYWVPLMAAYSGAAREEICGLEIDNVILDCAVPHIWIRNNMTRSKDGERKAGMKAPARYRHVPLHPELLRLGFADYVRAITKERHKQLFPELFIIATGGGAKFYARAWKPMVDAVDAELPLFRSSDGKRADFHSLRTYSESVLADIDAHLGDIDKILGHASTGTGTRSYNRRKIVIGIEQFLRELLQLMTDTFPVVTAHLSPAPVKMLSLKDRSRTGTA